jgi:uncharacterized protein (DUF2141 family)
MTAVVGLSVFTIALASTPSRAPGRDQIQAEILNLKSDRGTVYCSIYRAPGIGFPIDPSKAIKFARSKIGNRRARCDFDRLGPGVFAVGMMHDENNNRRFDKNWLGMPAEGYGVSRDAIRKFRVPRFHEAAFSYGGGTVRIAIHAHY